MGQHAQMHLRVGVPGEAAVANLALLLRLLDGLEHAVGDEDRVGLRVGQDLVHLPEVQVIGLQPPQGILQHGQGLLLGFLPLVVGADLGHQEHLVALALHGDAHPFLGAPFGVLPGIVEEGDAHINGGMDDAGGLLEGLRPGQRGAAEAERGHHLGVAAELALRHRPDGGRVGGENGRGIAGKDHPCAGGAQGLQEAATMLLSERVWHRKDYSPGMRPAKSICARSRPLPASGQGLRLSTVRP